MTIPSVLLVEDDPVIRRMLEVALMRESLRVDTASDGVEALELLAATPYAVLLLDLMMPRMSGFEVLEHLGQQQKRQPLVFVISAYDDATLRDLDPRLVHAIVRKPFDLERLVEVVRECATLWQESAPETKGSSAFRVSSPRNTHDRPT
ncbi:MAG TPA: response regulator [Thermoanaerobaculia bacterium]|nr:response regulator [Thermoanaerobaculia bacterium]